MYNLLYYEPSQDRLIVELSGTNFVVVNTKDNQYTIPIDGDIDEYGKRRGFIKCSGKTFIMETDLKDYRKCSEIVDMKIEHLSKSFPILLKYLANNTLYKQIGFLDRLIYKIQTKRKLKALQKEIYELYLNQWKNYPYS